MTPKVVLWNLHTCTLALIQLFAHIHITHNIYLHVHGYLLTLAYTEKGESGGGRGGWRENVLNFPTLRIWVCDSSFKECC